MEVMHRWVMNRLCRAPGHRFVKKWCSGFFYMSSPLCLSTVSASAPSTLSHKPPSPVVQSTPYPFWVLLMLPILLDIKASAGQTIGMVWKHHAPRLALRHLQYPLTPYVRVPVRVPSALFLIKLPANAAWKAAEEGPSVFSPWHTCGRSAWNSRINPSSYSHLESESAHGSLPFLSATLAIQINKS